ncbi:MAG: hypothetical protein L6R28_22780 [Planctomycetes bacterium]|nr:hypothetical protein [Planctomycetota bacterium]
MTIERSPNPRPGTKRSGRPALALLALVSGLGLAMLLGWIFFHGAVTQAGPEQDEPGEWVPVERLATFPVVVPEDGELQPVKNNTVGFRTEGKLAWILPEGTHVKKGDKLAELETDDLKEEIQNIADDLATAEKNLAEQEQLKTLEFKRLEAESLAEKDRVELARMREKEVLERPTALEKESAEIGLKKAEARVTAAREELKSSQMLLENGVEQRAKYETKVVDLKLAENELEREKLKARKVLDGATEAERRKAHLERQDAEIKYKLKLIDRDDALANIEGKVRSAGNAVKSLRARLTDRQHRLEDCVVYAPHDGSMTYRDMSWNGTGEKIQIGDRVRNWRPPIDLPSYDVMKVRSMVPESIVRLLHPRKVGGGGEVLQPGSPVAVTVKTLPGRVYKAEVTWIDGWSRDRNDKLSEADIKHQGLAGVRVFDIEVEILEKDTEHLRAGFNAVVDYPIETLADVLVIPSHAVTAVEGQTTVRVRQDGRLVTRPVTLGPESKGKVVVTEGLKEGERIWVPPAPKEEEEQRPKEKDPDKKAAPPGMNGPTALPAGPPANGGGQRPRGGAEGGGRSRGGRSGGGRGGGGPH